MLKITSPITGDDLQVAIQDFTNTMRWENAKRACIELGSGWRLPTIEELEAMDEQLHKKDQGNFKRGFYWSSTELNDNAARGFAFGNEFYISDKTMEYHVRAVRAF